jgi:hypothetical protein
MKKKNPRCKSDMEMELTWILQARTWEITLNDALQFD